MRYTFYRGLVQVSKWARLKFAAMNLKKLAKRKTKRQRSAPFPPLSIYLSILHFAPCLPSFGQAAFRLAGRFQKKRSLFHQ